MHLELVFQRNIIVKWLHKNAFLCKLYETVYVMDSVVSIKTIKLSEFSDLATSRC